MNDEFLKNRLRRVGRRYQWLAFWRTLAASWAAGALVGALLVWVLRTTGWSSPFLLPSYAALVGMIGVTLALRQFTKAPDYRWIAQKIEAQHPELNGVLLTAVQDALLREGQAGYFQHRILQEATTQSQQQDWRRVISPARLLVVQGVHLVALACLLFALAQLRVNGGRHGMDAAGPRWVGVDGLVITPGDASVEKGDSFVVLARFARSLPPTVSLVVNQSGAPARTIPLVKSLGDPVFGGSVPEVASDFNYHLEYRGQRTRDFKVTVFEHPRVVRADVDLTFPGYTKLAPKHIEDTRRVSAVEGTKLDYALQLNKPVKSARLVTRDAKKTAIPLTVQPGKAVATLPAFVPEKSQVYDLQLVDEEGRANKVATSIAIDVQPNRPPEIRMTSPRGDVRPSALEEVTFDGTVWDDFGSPAYGLAYAIAGQETKFVELGRDIAAKDKRTFNHLLNLEALGAKPDDLVSWYVWADDIGPDGKVRRTNGDLYFAEIRPFDEIFRESQDMQQDDQQQKQGGQQGNQRRKLTDLQKQIINATWKLQREGATPRYADDAKVVSDSQAQVLEQATEAFQEARTPRDQALWKEATSQMETAIDKLKDAAKTPGPLAQALPPEQAAYQALLKLQQRETNVTRRRGGGGGGGGGQANQRQIDQLDLQQSQNRYETQRQAQSPQNPERREQLAVMNRLQELARRQQDLNERLKELQTSLQEARTEQEREEAQRRLKRLEEEQRQMIADADEVRQRMDRAENQSNMSQQRQQLDQTRDDLQKAADATAGGSVAQALASGTRAQRQLQEMRDDLRKQNSSQFADDLRDMRAEARELSRQQEEIGQKLDSLSTPNNSANQRKSLSGSGDRQQLLDDLAQQKERMNKLVERAQQISEQAENTEPLLSKQLYDSVRKLSQDDANTVKQARQELLSSGRLTRDLYNRLQQTAEREAGGKSLDLTSDLLREDYLPQASQAGQRARGQIDDLRRGVERAADSVLGDDAEQLKLAQNELDQLTDQLQRELAQAQGQNGQPGGTAAGQAGQAGTVPQPRQGGDQRQAGTQAGEAGQQPGEQAGAGDEKQGQPGERNGQQPGRGQRGERPGELAQANQRGGGGNQQPGENPGEQPGGQAGQGGQPNQQANAVGQPGGQGGQQPGGQQGQQNGRGQQQGNRGGNRLAGNRGGQNQGGGGNRGGGFSVDDFLGGTERGGIGGPRATTDAGGPLLGEDFGRWNERLTDVESLLDSPDLRNAVATARERARVLRRDFKQDLKKPDWTVVKLEILKPLVEVRAHVAEELARRDSKESLAPIDRDPVPNRFAESVRRYYEELGKDKPEAVR